MLHYCMIIIFSSAVWRRATTPSLCIHSPLPSHSRHPCSCFCDSAVASNELRRNCTTGRVTAPGHVSTTLLAAQQSHPLLSVPLKPQMFSPNFSFCNFRSAGHQGSNNMGGWRRCPNPPKGPNCFSFHHSFLTKATNCCSIAVPCALSDSVYNTRSPIQ